MQKVYADLCMRRSNTFVIQYYNKDNLMITKLNKSCTITKSLVLFYGDRDHTESCENII